MRGGAVVKTPADNLAEAYADVMERRRKQQAARNYQFSVTGATYDRLRERALKRGVTLNVLIAEMLNKAEGL